MVFDWYFFTTFIEIVKFNFYHATGPIAIKNVSGYRTYSHSVDFMAALWKKILFSGCFVDAFFEEAIDFLVDPYY